MTGFNKVMRFCNTLQDYESAKNQGTITDDLFVVILQDKLAKFKGQTFDWSQNADLTALATKGELTNLRNEVIDNEEVAALAITELKEKIDAVNRNISGALVTKNELNSAIDSLTSTIDDNKSACVSSINELDERKADKEYVENALKNIDTSDLATKEEVQNLNDEIIANEEVHAAALNDLNERLNNIGSSSGSGAVTFYAVIDGGELSEKYKSQNANAFNSYKFGQPIIIVGIAGGNEVSTLFPMSVAYQENTGGESGLSFIACSFPMLTASGSYSAILFYEDGSIMAQL